MADLNRRVWMYQALASAGLAGVSVVQAENAGPVYRVYGVEMPPLIMGTPHGSTGIVVDTVQEAFKRAGLSVEVVVVPWARAYADVKAGEAAGLIPTIRSAEREEIFDFPEEPVFRAEMSFFGLLSRGFKWSGKLSELEHLRFVRLRGALFSPEFDQAISSGRIYCEQANSFSAALRMVAAGRVDLAAVPKLAGLQIAVAEGLHTRVQPLEPALHVQNFYLAFARKPGMAEVRQRINEQLAQMQKDGSLRLIQEGYRKRNWLAPSPASKG